MGQTVGGEFRVDSNYTNSQGEVDVAMNKFGQFVVVWATMGQPYSYFNDIHAQIYAADGSKIGGEFRVNSKDIPGTNPSVFDPAGSNELNPSVAIDNAGDFVVSWDRTVFEQNGVAYNTDIFARLFNAAGTALPNSISAALTIRQRSSK